MDDLNKFLVKLKLLKDEVENIDSSNTEDTLIQASNMESYFDFDNTSTNNIEIISSDPIVENKDKQIKKQKKNASFTM